MISPRRAFTERGRGYQNSETSDSQTIDGKSMENSKSRMPSVRIVVSALQRAKIGPWPRQVPTHAYEMRAAGSAFERPMRAEMEKEGCGWNGARIFPSVSLFSLEKQPDRISLTTVETKILKTTQVGRTGGQNPLQIIAANGPFAAI